MLRMEEIITVKDLLNKRQYQEVTLNWGIFVISFHYTKLFIFSACHFLLDNRYRNEQNHKVTESKIFWLFYAEQKSIKHIDDNNLK